MSSINIYARCLGLAHDILDMMRSAAHGRRRRRRSTVPLAHLLFALLETRDRLLRLLQFALQQLKVGLQSLSIVVVLGGHRGRRLFIGGGGAAARRRRQRKCHCGQRFARCRR